MKNSPGWSSIVVAFIFLIAVASLGGQSDRPMTGGGPPDQITFIAGSSGGTQLSASLDTGSISLNTGQGKLFVAIVSWIAPTRNTITSVAWNPIKEKQLFSPVSAAVSYGRRSIQIFELANPAAGTDTSVRATWSDAGNGTQGIVAAVYSCTCEKLRVADWNTTSGTGDMIRIGVPHVGSGDMVMDSWMHEYGDPGIGANQTLIGEVVTPGNAHGGSYQAGQHGGLMSWFGFPARGEYLAAALRITASSGRQNTTEH